MDARVRTHGAASKKAFCVSHNDFTSGTGGEGRPNHQDEIKIKVSCCYYRLDQGIKASRHQGFEGENWVRCHLWRPLLIIDALRRETNRDCGL